MLAVTGNTGDKVNKLTISTLFTNLTKTAGAGCNLSTLICIIMKFPYDTRSDWLKEYALSENRVRVDGGKVTLKFLLWNFDKFAPN